MKMSNLNDNQEPVLLWYAGVIDDDGLDWFEPATKENAFMAFVRARSNSHRNAKAFLVALTEETEKSIYSCITDANFKMAKLIIESVEEIKYVQ